MKKISVAAFIAAFIAAVLVAYEVTRPVHIVIKVEKTIWCPSEGYDFVDTRRLLEAGLPAHGCEYWKNP